MNFQDAATLRQFLKFLYTGELEGPVNRALLELLKNNLDFFFTSPFFNCMQAKADTATNVFGPAVYPPTSSQTRPAF